MVMLRADATDSLHLRRTMVTLNVKPNGNSPVINALLFCLILALIIFIVLQCTVIAYLIIQEIRMALQAYHCFGRCI